MKDSNKLIDKETEKEKREEDLERGREEKKNTGKNKKNSRKGKGRMAAIHLSDLLSRKVDSSSFSRSDWLMLKYSRMYFFMALIQLVVVLFVNIVIVVLDAVETVGEENDSKTSQWSMYSYIYIIVVFHQAWLVWDGVRYTNIIEIYGFTALNGVYIYYGALQLIDVHAHANSSTILAMSVISVSTLILCFCAGAYFTKAISNQYRWEMFKAVGNNDRLRSAWFYCLVFQLFLKMSLIFFFIFLLMNLSCLSEHYSIFWYVCWAFIPFTLLVYITGHIFVISSESVAGATLYLVLKGACLLFLLFLQVCLFKKKTPIPGMPSYSDNRSNVNVVFLVSLGIINSLVLLINIVVGIICASNFGKGINEFATHYRKTTAECSFLKSRVNLLSANLMEAQRKSIRKARVTSDESSSVITPSMSDIPTETASDLHSSSSPPTTHINITPPDTYSIDQHTNNNSGVPIHNAHGPRRPSDRRAPVFYLASSEEKKEAAGEKEGKLSV